MKKLYFLMITVLVTSFSYGQTVFINEIHYDNEGGDINEAIEIAGPSGTDLTGYSVVAYNGIDGASYATISLGANISYQNNGYGTAYFFSYGLQNGAPDGIALVDPSSTVIQFLSYEGSFEAIDGPASGMTSTDIGVAETGTTPAGFSLQLGGSGTEYSHFSWQEAMAHTMGQINTNQDLGGTPPASLTITSPTNGAIFNPEVSDLDITLSIQNFVVANGTGDGHIAWDLNGGTSTDKFDTDPIALTGLTPGSYNMFVELLDNSGASLSPPVEADINFTISSYTQVVNLADLRAGIVGNYYEVTGEVIGTYGQSYNNQKWAQDATAGILIDDNAGVIITAYNEFDGVTGLKGQLDAYNGLLQIIPSADPGAATSTGNTITPEVVTIATLNANLADYESELIEIVTADITDISGGDGTFQTGKNYVLTDASGIGVLRTNFYGADYIGTALPTTANNYVCLVGSYDGTTQVTPREITDMVLGLSQQTIEGFSLYPNPVTNGMLTINTQDNLEKNIQIFDILGKQVFAKTINTSTINVANLNSGIYIIRVEEAGRLATRKLVIE